MKVQCDFEGCGKFVEKKSLARHKLIVHSNLLPFECDKCGKKYPVKDNLDQHNKTVHLKLKVSCKDCGTQFLTRSLRTRHTNRAKENHPFQCEHCCVSYERSSWLNKHTIKAHPDIARNRQAVMDRQHQEPASDNTSLGSSSKRNSLLRGITPKRKISTDQSVPYPAPKKVIYCASNSVNEENDVTEVPQTQPPPTQFPLTQSQTTDETDESTNMGRSKLDNCFDSNIITKTKEVQSLLSSEDDEEDDPGDSEIFQLTQTEQDEGVSTEQDEDVSEGIVSKHNVGAPQLGDYRYDPYFLLHTWGFVKNVKYLEDFLKEQYKDDKLLLDSIFNFIGGNTDFHNNSELKLFLDGNPQNYIGEFVVACVIVDYCFEKNTSTVLDLLMEISAEWQPLVKTTARYLVQRALREGTMDDFEMTEEIRESINYGFLCIISSHDKDIQTNYETSIASEIHTVLIDLLFRDTRKTDIALLDCAYDALSRAQIWTRIAEIIISSRYSSPRGKIIDQLLLSNLKLRVSTVEYFKIKIEDTYEPIHFHQEVVNRFGKPEPNLDTVIKATNEDVQIMTNLMYCDYNNAEINGMISVGVYRIARQLKIDNLWWFLFRNQKFEQVMQTTRKQDIIQILICAKMDEFIDKIAATYHHEPEKCRLLNGLDAGSLEYFLQNESLKLTQFERYEIMVRCSYASCGKTFTEISSVAYEKDANRYFNLVRHLVKIEDLKDKWELIGKHGFMVTEILKARKIKKSQE